MILLLPYAWPWVRKKKLSLVSKFVSGLRNGVSDSVSVFLWGSLTEFLASYVCQFKNFETGDGTASKKEGTSGGLDPGRPVNQKD